MSALRIPGGYIEGFGYGAEIVTLTEHESVTSALVSALTDYVDQTTRYINGHGNLPDSTRARAALAKAGAL